MGNSYLFVTAFYQHEVTVGMSQLECEELLPEHRRRGCYPLNM